MASLCANILSKCSGHRFQFDLVYSLFYIGKYGACYSTRLDSREMCALLKVHLVSVLNKSHRNILCVCTQKHLNRATVNDGNSWWPFETGIIETFKITYDRWSVFLRGATISLASTQQRHTFRLIRAIYVSWVDVKCGRFCIVCTQSSFVIAFMLTETIYLPAIWNGTKTSCFLLLFWLLANSTNNNQRMNSWFSDGN